jgi:hypothetical protein
MERYGLSEKTKEELIDIILRKDGTEKKMGKRLRANAIALTKEKSNKEKLIRACNLLSIILLVLMISITIVLFF